METSYYDLLTTRDYAPGNLVGMFGAKFIERGFITAMNSLVPPRCHVLMSMIE